MKIGLILVLALFVACESMAAVQFDGPISEVSALSSQRDSMDFSTVTGIQATSDTTSSWQIQSLSYSGSSSNLEGLEGSIAQTADVPEPATTAMIIGAFCVLFVLFRKRSAIARPQ